MSDNQGCQLAAELKINVVQETSDGEMSEEKDLDVKKTSPAYVAEQHHTAQPRGEHASASRFHESSWYHTDRSFNEQEFLEGDIPWLCGYGENTDTASVSDSADQAISRPTDTGRSRPYNDQVSYYVDTTVAEVDIDNFYRGDIGRILDATPGFPENDQDLEQSTSQLFSSNREDMETSTNLSIDSLNSSLMEAEKIAHSCITNRHNYTIAFSASINKSNPGGKVTYQSLEPSNTVEKYPEEENQAMCWNSGRRCKNREQNTSLTEYLAVKGAGSDELFASQAMKTYSNVLPTQTHLETHKARIEGDSCGDSGSPSVDGNSSLLTTFLNQRFSGSNSPSDGAIKKEFNIEYVHEPCVNEQTLQRQQFASTTESRLSEVVRLRRPRQRPSSVLVDAERPVRTIDSHRFSMPLVDNSMQTSVAPITRQMEQAKVVYLLYPQYSLPNLRFIAESPTENVFNLCPTSLRPPNLRPAPTTGVCRRPLSCSDIEQLKQQNFSRIRDWDSLCQLLPQDIFDLLKQWNVSEIEAYTKNRRNRKLFIKPSNCSLPHSHIHSQACGDIPSSPDSLQSWLKAKIPLDNLQRCVRDSCKMSRDHIKLANFPKIPPGTSSNMCPMAISKIRASNERDELECIEEFPSTATEKRRSGQKTKVELHSSSTNKRSGAQDKTTGLNTRQYFCDITGPIYDAIEAIESHYDSELSSSHDDMYSVLVVRLCSSLHTLLSQGLRPSTGLQNGGSSRAVWLLVEYVGKEQSTERSIRQFIRKLNCDGLLLDYAFRFCAFVSHLLEKRKLACFLSSLSANKKIMRQHYKADAMMFQASWAASAEFNRLLSKLQRVNDKLGACVSGHKHCVSPTSSFRRVPIWKSKQANASSGIDKVSTTAGDRVKFTKQFCHNLSRKNTQSQAEVAENKKQTIAQNKLQMIDKNPCSGQEILLETIKHTTVLGERKAGLSGDCQATSSLTGVDRISINDNKLDAGIYSDHMQSDLSSTPGENASNKHKNNKVNVRAKSETVVTKKQSLVKTAKHASHEINYTEDLQTVRSGVRFHDLKEHWESIAASRSPPHNCSKMTRQHSEKFIRRKSGARESRIPRPISSDGSTLLHPLPGGAK